MLIKNLTQNKELKAMHAKSVPALTKGLMFKKKGNMLLEFPISRRHGIWMLFMRYPLDLIYINQEKKVTEIKKDIPPLTFDPRTWKTYNPRHKARYILEVEKEKSVDFNIGDRLEFKD